MNCKNKHKMYQAKYSANTTLFSLSAEWSVLGKGDFLHNMSQFKSMKYNLVVSGTFMNRKREEREGEERYVIRKGEGKWRERQGQRDRERKRK